MAKKSKSDDGKLCAILAYLLIGIIWYFVDDNVRKNKFANFHVKQAIVLLVTWVAVSVVLGILFFLVFIWPIIHLALTILWLFGIIYAIRGEEKEIPIVGKFASKLKF